MPMAAEKPLGKEKNMRWGKAQLEIFKILLKGEFASPPARGFWITQGRKEALVVTGNGYNGYVFPKDEIVFDAEKVKLCNDFLGDWESIICPENKLTVTDYFRKIDRRMARVFEGKNGKIYINSVLLSCFDVANASFYQEKANRSVLVVEYEKLVGLVLPIRVTDDTD